MSAKCQISAIRELVPRLLIEVALFRSLRIAYPLREFEAYALRLVSRLRGISDPLICAYVHLFALERMFWTMGANDRIVTWILRDVLFVFRAMHVRNFVGVEAVFYGQMESVDFLNLFNPLFAMVADVLLFDGTVSPQQLKRRLLQQIEPDLFRFVDFDSFLGIKKKGKAKDGGGVFAITVILTSHAVTTSPLFSAQKPA